MGVDLRDLIPPSAKREVELPALKGEAVALDAYNALYQFLAAIRQPDGTPLMDSRGRVTSHLSGLFYRTVSLLEEGLKPIYVFDGRPPEMKAKEIEERARRRAEAEEKYRAAVSAGLLEEARRYAQASSRLTRDMAEEAKRLLTAMGVPYVQAPEEGEAQAAHIARKGDAFAAASQDYDSILFGAPRLVRNLTISGRRKLPGKEAYVELRPEIIDAEALLKALGITREQLIAIGIIVGTDYNPGGVRGYGVQRALKHVKAIGDPVKALKAIPAQEWGDADPLKIYEYFLSPAVSDRYSISFSEPDEAAVKELLVEEHDFDAERVERALERLRRGVKEAKGKQRKLDSWF